MLHYLRVGLRLPLRNRTRMQCSKRTRTRQWPGALKPKSYSLVEGNRSIVPMVTAMLLSTVPGHHIGSPCKRTNQKFHKFSSLWTKRCAASGTPWSSRHSIAKTSVFTIEILKTLNTMSYGIRKFWCWTFTQHASFYLTSYVTDMNHITHRRFFVHLYQPIHWYVGSTQARCYQPM